MISQLDGCFDRLDQFTIDLGISRLFVPSRPCTEPDLPRVCQEVCSQNDQVILLTTGTETPSLSLTVGIAFRVLDILTAQLVVCCGDQETWSAALGKFLGCVNSRDRQFPQNMRGRGGARIIILYIIWISLLRHIASGFHYDNEDGGSKWHCGLLVQFVFSTVGNRG